MMDQKTHPRILRSCLILWIVIFCILSCSACTNRSTTKEERPSDPGILYRSEVVSPNSSPALTLPQTTAQLKVRTPRPTHTPSQIPNEKNIVIKLCPPIANVQINELADLIVNPYNPPPPGSDAPHQGIDLAILSPGTRIALNGKPVQAVVDGSVAGVINQRFPYGNAIIIETPLSLLPHAWLTVLDFPKLQPTITAKPALTCPDAGLQPGWDTNNRSIYLLYAHLQNPSQYKIGDKITCGDTLGEIGKSGNALNPHLHLELRIGPAEAQFPSMAHYDTSATPLEMETYCLWRVSGLFQVIDPGRLFKMKP